ncbi:MAG: CaiB/BaiF CoA transferase family protein [Bacillus sp. (in: firmicutes)]
MMTLLNGLKILDFSTLLPGPYATMMLADYGADVLRVEAPTRWDYIKEGFPKDDGTSVVHSYLNRSKKSIGLNLKEEKAIEVVKELVKEYDIVIEQFRPGVMDRLGIGYEQLKEINPKLIYCSITGYGQTGPYRHRPGHDNNFLSISGINGYSGKKVDGPPLMGTQIADIAGGSFHAVIGILTAYIHREKTGEGQWIDVSMTDAAFALNAMFAPGYLACDIEPEAEALPLNGAGFYDYYKTKDGRYFSVASIETPFKKLLLEAIDRPDLTDIGFSEKQEDEQLFKKELQEIFLSKTFAEWEHIFQKIEACVEPVLTLAEACSHPQIQARNMIVDVQKPNGSYQKQIANPIKFSAAEVHYKHTGHDLGENTEEILVSIGIEKDQITEWQKNGIVK